MIGQILNHRYRVTDLIGSGGMATVYRATNITTRKVVAIKVLKEEFKDNPEFLRRFEREARAVLHLSHDNIVRAYGVGQHEGLPFIVLEYVDGKTLKQMIVDDGPLSPRAAIDIAYQVLDALSAAHEAGIIHRDIKPQNVIITPAGKAKLTDFGIAREASASTVTYAGSTVLGSVHYLSPEQAKGKPVTAASDIYSTGIMLYEMLTGDVPFGGDNSVSIALKHINEKPTPPIEKNPAIPPALNDVVMKALSKTTSDRYVSARAMRSDLLRAQYDPYGSFARGNGAGTAPSVAPRHPKTPSDRKPTPPYVSIGAVVLALVAVLIVVFFAVRGSLSGNAISLQVVPALTGRPIAEAQSKAGDYGFVFEIDEYEASETVPFGNVIDQTPVAGTNAKPGSVIKGVISLGPNAPKMPNLIGMTPDEARKALEQEGLALGSIRYMISDVKIGYICQQSIPFDVEVQRGQVVDITISSTSSEGIAMPQLVGEPFYNAMRLLGLHAFDTILVRIAYQENAAANTVLSQTPTANTTVQSITRVEIAINRALPFPYAADVAFNVDVGTAGAEMMVTVIEIANDNVPYERVLVERSLTKGEKVPVSFTAGSDASGMHELIVYIDGQEYKRQEVSFAPRVS